MNAYPQLTNIRSKLSDKFFTLRTDARRDALWAKLMGKNTELAIFPEQAPEKGPNRQFTGTQDIPIEQITGTLNRQNDFDHKFRPLQHYLRDRWVNVYLSLENSDWGPIVVHKVGENYYVEDGHHRVSVARLQGIQFIQAKVWEYPVHVRQTKECQAERCPERSSKTAYAAR
jgi:hypothetical protein